jgi:uracil-DNA glycosylase
MAIKSPRTAGFLILPEEVVCAQKPFPSGHASWQKTGMTQSNSVKLDPGWMNLVGGEFDQPYMKALKEFLKQEKTAGHIIYPKGNDIFNALNTTPFDRVRVVILGQDPYHGPDQAHGLAFSVREGIKLPPSLVNIYKEIESACGVAMPRKGDLTGWARQGVLLLNATLTVQAERAGSHQGRGWEQFTDAVIRALNERGEHIVFMLWGSYAHKKGAFIDREKHLVLQAPHPSPLSAHRGFLGCGHFKKANEYLMRHGREPIDWTAVE